LELSSLGDTMTLTVALMACLLGYGEVGLWLQKESKNEKSWVIMEGNPYKLWIDDYSGEIYQKAVKEGLGSVPFYF
jgi:hydroxymethylpyrimidine/phosphomethylpyrimidine kinase / thiaminase